MTIVSKRLACGAVIAAFLLASPRRAAFEAVAQKSAAAEQERGIAEVTTTFADTVSLARARGPATPLRVDLKQWHLAGQGVPIEISDQGFYVAHLVWGNVSTQLGGATTVRKPGDFWTVEKGSRMTVTIKKPGEEALIQTFSLNPGR